jgi:hypothetical protein
LFSTIRLNSPRFAFGHASHFLETGVFAPVIFKKEVNWP